MFTGIIEEIGKLQKRYSSQEKYQLQIEAKKVVKDLTRGESIAVNGVCLSVVSFTANSFTADIMPETLRKTNLEDMKKGANLNLELPLKANDFMGGHLVSGHVDGVGSLKNVDSDNNAKILSIEISPELNKYMVKKGSVALNGISLTIMDISQKILKVSLIPETWKQTNLRFLKPGAGINIETDLIGKYVVKMWENYQNGSGQSVESESNIDKDFLQNNGFI